MDQKNLILAIVLSVLIIGGWQYAFPPAKVAPPTQTATQTTAQPNAPATAPGSAAPGSATPTAPGAPSAPAAPGAAGTTPDALPLDKALAQ